jgi:hypothetical protein
MPLKNQSADGSAESSTDASCRNFALLQESVRGTNSLYPTSLVRQTLRQRLGLVTVPQRNSRSHAYATTACQSLGGNAMGQKLGVGVAN